MKFYVMHCNGDRVWGWMTELGSFPTETAVYEWIAANVHELERGDYKCSEPF